MSKYESIVPEDIASNTFDFHGASIEIIASSVYPGYEPYMFFNFNRYASTVNTPPPHFVEIKSSSPLVIDQFDFSATDDVIYMTAKDYKIEASMDGESWNTVYSGIVPSTSRYNKQCEFEPIICKQIRLTVLSTYDQRGYKWFQGGHIKIYGALAGSKLYTNQHAYAIPK